MLNYMFHSYDHLENNVMVKRTSLSIEHTDYMFHSCNILFQLNSFRWIQLLQAKSAGSSEGVQYKRYKTSSKPRSMTRGMEMSDQSESHDELRQHRVPPRR